MIHKALKISAVMSVPLPAIADGPSVTEIITFHAQPGASADAVTAALGPIEAKIGQYGTLVARSVAQGPAGQWTIVNYWTERDAMNRVNDLALPWQGFGVLSAVANLETLQMQQIDVSKTIGLRD
ncbi:MAG: hypothetical protein AAF066_01220 [Pseudomonadota bacterium]